MSRPYIPTRANEPHSTIRFETRPRHLAGPADARHVTHGLAAAGWSARPTR
ncbi:hypothetical protein [Streptomyces chattanoogensis]|uniref:hypothetical protein n=1 Tax=Streptomyces chattanoogensis TaxID=66876 RepID=UPI000A4ECC07